MSSRGAWHGGRRRCWMQQLIQVRIEGYRGARESKQVPEEKSYL